MSYFFLAFTLLVRGPERRGLCPPKSGITESGEFTEISHSFVSHVNVFHQQSGFLGKFVTGTSLKTMPWMT